MRCDVVDGLYEVMDHVVRKGREPMCFGLGVPLYRADIEFLDAVTAHPGESLTGLAKILGVTRGAVTQRSNRMEEFGLIERRHLEGNRKVKYIFLTSKGERVFAERERRHRDANAAICRFMRGLHPKQIDAILRFLNVVATLDVSPFQCTHGCSAIREGGKRHA